MLHSVAGRLVDGGLIQTRPFREPHHLASMAALSPCRYGNLGGPSRACGSAPACGCKYAAWVSGRIIDRFDLIIKVRDVTPATLFALAESETTAVITWRVEAAYAYAALLPQQAADYANARLQPDQLAEVMICDDDATLFLQTAIEHSRLSARAYHKVQRVARSIADLKAEVTISRPKIAEATAYWAMLLLA